MALATRWLQTDGQEAKPYSWWRNSYADLDEFGIGVR